MIRTLLLLAALALAAPQSVWAMACIRADGPDADLYEDIGSTVRVPTTVPDGTVIWRGATRSIAAMCYRDLDNARDETEIISFYVNPINVAPASWGIDFGMRVNGVDLWPQGGGGGAAIPTVGRVVPCPTLPRDQCPTSGIFYVTFQPVIRKRGLTPFSPPPDADYVLYQLDGIQGLNVTRHNFQYHITGLDKIQATDCTVDVTVTPSPGVVDFGTIQTGVNGFSPSNPSQTFSLLLDKTGCSTPVIVNGFLSTPYERNGLILPKSDSNFGISLYNLSAQQPIALETPFFLANFSSTDTTKEVSMRADLTAFGPIEPGPFTATATIQILYL